jgi:hypothetical protein
MSGAEVHHRLRAAARRQLGWLPGLPSVRDDRWVARTLASPERRAALPAHLARALAARIYGPDWTPARLAEGLASAGAAARIVAEADDVRTHRLRVLGYGVLPVGEPIDWHRDPLGRGQWPRRYWGRMSRGETQGLDPKVIWEPSRHQHFQVLAAAAALTGDRRYADEVADHLEGWIAQNPTGIGIHWVESIEPAFRLLAWLWALPLVLDVPRFTPELCATVLRSLVAQARHVAANLSTYTSPNTHLLAEALALFVVGTVLPELEAAAGWRAQGLAILEQELAVQVGDDGVYREASLYYHAYTAELALLVAVLAERNGVALAPVVRACLGRMLEALTWLVRPDGALPNLGDADGGRGLRLGAPNLTRVDELLASGAVLLNRPELRGGRPATGEEAAWLWPDGVRRLQRLGRAAAPVGARRFPDARLAVERRRVGDDERWALLDVRDLGMLSGGHGHAGCLGLELYAQGRALVVDRGTYVYNAAPEWRRYFRGTRAHSTVVIDDLDQADVAGEFLWGSRYRSWLVRHAWTPEYGVVTGEHDGYTRLPDPVRHRRTLVSVGGEYWLCVDVLEGAGTHAAEFLFHLAPGMEVDAGAGTAFAAPPGSPDGLLLAGAGFADTRPRVLCGVLDPLQGWHSDDYGDRRPAPTVSTRERLRAPAVRAHLLAPCARAARARVRVESAGLPGGLAVTVHTAAGTDLVLCAAGGVRELTTPDVDFAGELLHARLDADGRPRRLLAVRPRRLRWHGQALLAEHDHADSVDLADIRPPAPADAGSVALDVSGRFQPRGIAAPCERV